MSKVADSNSYTTVVHTYIHTIKFVKRSGAKKSNLRRWMALNCAKECYNRLRGRVVFCWDLKDAEESMVGFE